MVIEISKPKVKKVPWLRIALSIVSTLFLVFLLSYFIFIFYQAKLKKESSELEKKLARTPTEKTLEQSLRAIKNQIEDWRLITTNHLLASRAFKLLEKNTHPQVWFSDFKLNLERATINLGGSTDSFETLDQQLLIFEKQEFVKKAILSKVSKGREGEIIFNFHLELDPKIFKPDLSSEIK